jgi:hypothetical protein
MLTLDHPINLVLQEDALGLSDSFGERIRANYEIMTANFSSEELLFLLVNPQEVPYAEGDFICIAMGDVRKDTQNILFGVVNNIVNRILSEDLRALTYQDTVYLDTALRKLGVENVAHFMEQVRVLRAENESVNRLTELYRDNLTTLRETPARETESRGKAARTTDPEGDTDVKDRALYLHSEIYKRLDTAGIVRTFARFAQNAPESRTRVDAREMRISEQQQAMMTLALNEYRRDIPAFAAGDIYYNRNLYETGDPPDAPRDEKSVLRQALSAALLQLIDNVTTSRAAYPANRSDVWLDITEALYASARNSVERFLSFREHIADANAVTRREPADLRMLLSLSVSEEDILSRHLESLRAPCEGRGKRPAKPRTDAPADAPHTPEDADAARDVRESARRTLLELARIHSARLRATETLTRRVRERVSEDASVSPPSARIERLASEEAAEREGRADGMAPLTHAARTLAGEESAAAARETDARSDAAFAASVPADAAPPEAQDAAARLPARAIESPPSAHQAEGEETDFAESERVFFMPAKEADAPGKDAGESRAENASAYTGRGGDGAPGGEVPAMILSRIMESASSVYATERTDALLTESGRETLLLTQGERAYADRAADAEENERRGEMNDSAPSDAILREMLDRVNNENKERIELLKELRTETARETVAAAPRPDRKRIMRDALRAIENPEQVLSETLAREAVARPGDMGAQPEALVYADESSKRILELLQLLRKDPEAAAAAGVTVAAGPEALLADIAAATRARAEAAAPPAASLKHALARESPERPVERQGVAANTPPAAFPAAGGTAWESATPIIHRRPPPAPDFEELLQRRSERRVTEERARQGVTTETTVQTNEIRTQSDQIVQNLVAADAGDITEMINKTLMRQIGTITDKVYGQLEKKLKNEKSRRGRI